MELVPIPPPRIGEYSMDLEVARTRKPKATRLTFTIRDPLTTKPISAFLAVHERPFHLFIISRDLSSFSHVHPAQAADGRFTIEHELDPGEYVLIADFLPAGGTPQLIHRAFVTPGYSGALFARSPVLQASATENVAEGLRVRLDASGLMALRPSSLRFTVSDAETQTPVSDLEPYLGATAHLLIVNPDLTVAIHGHPEGVLSAGPDVAFDPILPLAGFYKLWVQFQRKGRVITVPFVIQVAPR